MPTTTVAAVRHRRANVIAAFLKRADEALRVAEVTLYPFLDLAIRLWLAQLFGEPVVRAGVAGTFVSGDGAGLR